MVNVMASSTSAASLVDWKMPASSWSLVGSFPMDE